MIRLIATDIDGTLIDASHRPSARTLAALTRARDEGVLVVPASGRQPFSIAEVLRDTWLAEGLVIGANGAVATDLGTGEMRNDQILWMVPGGWGARDAPSRG